MNNEESSISTSDSPLESLPCQTTDDGLTAEIERLRILNRRHEHTIGTLMAELETIKQMSRTDKMKLIELYNEQELE